MPRVQQLLAAAAIVIALVIGYFTAVDTPTAILLAGGLIGGLTVMSIWLLPDLAGSSTSTLWKALLFFIFALLTWPDYLAISIPGGPWLTLLRIASLPLVLILMITLAMKPALRRELAEASRYHSGLIKALIAFNILAGLTVVYSINPSGSLQRYMLAQINLMVPFLCALLCVNSGRRMQQFALLLLLITFIDGAIGVLEWQRSEVPWANSIPSIFRIEDPNVERFLSGTTRAGAGIHRVQSRFTTSLAFAEYLALAAPFILHLLITTRSNLMRVLTVAALALTIVVVRFTDSRLGLIGLIVTFFGYPAFYFGTRYLKDRSAVLPRAVLIAYPIMAVVLFVASLTVSAVHNRVWGGGVASSSTAARKIQFAMGLPKVASHPWGHGISQGGAALGYYDPSGIATIDSYYLSVALEYGVVGFVLFYGIFLVAIYRSARAYFRHTHEATAWLAPLTLALTEFVVIKGVFSQQDNHPLVFALLGATLAIVARTAPARIPAAARSAPGRSRPLAAAA